MKGLSVTNKGRPALTGPGKLDQITLKQHRARLRRQEVVYDIATGLTRDYARQPGCSVPAHILFPQIRAIVDRYLSQKVKLLGSADIRDVVFSPFYGWMIETLVQKIEGDTGEGETAELPRYENTRGPGSTADVDFWTGRDVRETLKSHVNYAVADTKVWEQSGSYAIDSHPAVEAWVKNAGLGFAVPYLHNGQKHDYVPDFLIRLKTKAGSVMLILELKGYDPLEEVKKSAAMRWVAAVNAEGSFGKWDYTMLKGPQAVASQLDSFRTA